VLHFDWLTPAQAYGGELDAASRLALTAAMRRRHELEANEVESQRRKLTPDEYIAASDDAINIEQVRSLWEDAHQDEALTDEVKTALHNRVAQLRAEVQADPGPVDAEIVHEEASNAEAR
jgi:hypothetical protein